MRDGDFTRPPTVSYTFSTGRTVTLLDSLPTSRLIRTGEWGDEMLDALQLALEGELDDAELAVRLVDAVAAAMWVDPQVVSDVDADPNNGLVGISSLDDRELAETFQVAMGGAALAAAFRDAWLAVLREDRDGGADAAHDAVELAGAAGDDGRAGGRPAGHEHAAGSRAAHA